MTIAPDASILALADATPRVHDEPVLASGAPVIGFTVGQVA